VKTMQDHQESGGREQRGEKSITSSHLACSRSNACEKYRRWGEMSGNPFPAVSRKARRLL